MELSSFPLLLAFLLSLFILVKKGKILKTKKRNPKLPPGPWKLPVIGSLHHVVGLLPHHKLRNLAKKHGPIMHLQLGEISTIVITSSKLAKEVMKTHDLKFVDRPKLLAAEIVTYGSRDLLFSPYGEYWKQMRKICTLELLSAKRVQSFQTLREEEVSSLMQSISSLNGSLVNFSEKVYTLVNDITARAAFGKKCKDKQAFISSVLEATQLAGGFEIADVFPSLKFLHAFSKLKPKLESIHRTVDRILEDIIKAHKEKCKTEQPEKNEHEDLVDVFLRLQKDDNFEIPITTENIKAVILDIFTAGSETSSTIMEWAMSELMRNPTLLEKAQAEVRRVFNGKREIKDTDVQELNYLKSVIKETLRLHPPPLILPRQCRETCEIDGYEIPVKTKVIINAWAIMRDPEQWKDAEKFVPERFHEEPVEYKGTNFEYIPFGGGRRMCPGILFGIANIELPFSQLLYHFDWKVPNGVNPEELDMTEAFGATVRRKNDLHLIATPYLK